MSGSWAFLADGALLEGQGSLAPVEVSFGVLLDALCPPTHAMVWALALASTGARLLGRHGFHHSVRLSLACRTTQVEWTMQLLRETLT